MGEFTNSLSPSSLLCQEDPAAFRLTDNDTVFYDHPCFDFDGGGVEYVENLIRREKDLSFFDDCSSPSNVDRSWLSFARLNAVEWILNTREIFGFQFNTAYLSIVYFERFLSKKFIDDGQFWAIRLLSVACLSLAAKMEECKVPTLSEFPVKDFRFENKVIQRMELLVLHTLDWKMGSVTPFAYLHYFINKICDESRPKVVVSKAVELIMSMIKEVNLLDHRPSIVAAAAVFAATNDQLTRKELELKMNGISSWGSVEIEHILSCYNAMQEIEMGKLKTPKQVMMSPNFSSLHSSSIDVLENSSFTSGAGSKRKLSFSECEQSSYTVKKICQP